MVIIRPTASLAKRMKIKLQHTSEKSTTRLGDWFANDFVLNRKQFILCMSSASRLCVVMQGAPYAKFPHRLENDVHVVLRELGVDPHLISEETNKMEDFYLAKTNDRSILGSMNDFRFHLEAHARHGKLNLDDTIGMSLILSKIITLTLPDSYPYETALKLFGCWEKERPSNVLEFKRPNVH